MNGLKIVRRKRKKEKKKKRKRERKMTTASETVLYASFSLEHSSITIGTTEGFYVFASDPLKLRYYRSTQINMQKRVFSFSFFIFFISFSSHPFFILF